jgi:NADH-quinone oxidoreductase subunit A
LVGILFLVFDVEISLILPWTSNLFLMGWFSFYLVIFFILILALGFVYEWKQGVLSWNKRVIVLINNV